MHISGFAGVNILLLFIVLLPLDTPNWLVLILSALIGITTDTISGFPAINTISCTLIGFIRPSAVNLFLGIKDATKRGVITASRLGSGRVAIFMFVLIAIQNIVNYTLESLSVVDVVFTILRVVTATISSFVFVYILHLPFFNKESANNKDF